MDPSAKRWIHLLALFVLFLNCHQETTALVNLSSLSSSLNARQLVTRTETKAGAGSTTTSTQRRASSFTKIFAKTAKKRLDKNRNFGPTKSSQRRDLSQDDDDDDDDEEEEEDAPLTLTEDLPKPLTDDRRAEAEQVIRDCVARVGANVLTLSWHRTQVVITLNEDFTPTQAFVALQQEQHEDEDSIWIDDIYENDDTGFEVEQPEEDEQDEEDSTTLQSGRIDSEAVSLITRMILNKFEDEQDELHFLSRYELILTSPGAKDVIETQREFEAFRGFDVIVETNEPVDSKMQSMGKLVERNDSVLIINKKGRKVSIALEKVKCVRLPPPKREKGVPRDAPF